MATEFSREFFSENRIVKADLRAAHQLREEDIARIKAEVKKLYDATEVILNVSVDESLLSGYVLQVGDRVFDNSGRHQLDQMMAGKPSLATLKTRIEDYKPAQTSAEGGVVISSADGIVQVEGMDKAVYGEIVTFENGAKGMVESVDPGKLGIMLFDGAETVGVGTLVTRSGKRAGIPVGDGFLGRVIDPLGEPIDGKGPVNAEGYNPIEKQAPGILERQSVDTPLHTGILAIDSMFPIGRGQRELIIGDRQTGKTSIATDAILNQKDTGVLCIYVAIGQKASSIARVAGDLQKHGAMSYTTIVAATASDSAPLQYIAPYAGTALAEYFMAQGGTFSLATGRAMPSFASVMDGVPMNGPTVLFNGAAIYDFPAGRYLRTAFLPECIRDHVRQLSQLMPGLTYEIYHDDNSIHVVNPNEITARHLHLTHTPSQQIASLDQAPSPISKLLFEEEPQRLRQLEEAIRAQDWSREYEVVASAVNLLEITARGANKGGMVRRLAELLGVRQENVCCVGDHANDIPMLEYAGMAFAPENAIPAVHRVPGIHILPDCRENAMAAMIEILDRCYS